MDLLNGFFRIMCVIAFEIPAAIAVTWFGLFILVKWTTWDDGEKREKLIRLGAASLFLAFCHWMIHGDNLASAVFFAAPFLLLLAAAGWLYFQFALTRLGIQLDKSADDLHSINQKNSPF